MGTIADTENWHLIEVHHILPKKDAFAHRLAPDCWCSPMVEQDGSLVHHKAADAAMLCSPVYLGREPSRQ